MTINEQKTQVMRIPNSENMITMIRKGKIPAVQHKFVRNTLQFVKEAYNHV